MGANQPEPGAAAVSPEQEMLAKIRADLETLLAQYPDLPAASVVQLVQAAAERTAAAPVLKVKRPDRKALAVMLPAISASIGAGVEFTVAAIFDYASADAKLRAALCGKTSRQVGDILRRGNGMLQNGMKLQKIGRGNEGGKWVLVIEKSSPGRHEVVTLSPL